MSTATNAFSGLKDAKSYESGNFYKTGIYKVEVVNTILKETRKAGLCFIAEFKTIESSNPEMPVGGKGTWIQKMNPPEISLGAIKEFAIAALGLDAKNDKEEIENEVSAGLEELMIDATSKNALKGHTLALEVAMKQTQKGGDFSKHYWKAA